MTLTIFSRPRSLILFFGLSFGVTWAVWVPAALASHGMTSFQLDPIVGSFGPFIAAVVTTAIYDGRAGFSRIFQALLKWRVGIQWYLFVLFWPAILSLTKTAIVILLGSAVPNFSQPPLVHLYPLPPELLKSVPFLVFLPFVFLQQTLIGSSMGEEIGWRGYALPRLQKTHKSLHASLVLGALWGIWHLPLWLTKDNPMQETFVVWPLLELIATSILFTWVYNNSQGSLLLALLFHSSIAVTRLFLASVETYPWLEAVLTWAMAALIVVGFRSKRFSQEAVSV